MESVEIIKMAKNTEFINMMNDLGAVKILKMWSPWGTAWGLLCKKSVFKRVIKGG